MWFWTPDGTSEAGATVSVADHGFTVGDGVFETLKVSDGRPFALTLHLDRLERSAAGLGLPAPDLERVREAVQHLMADSGIQRGRLRITYTSGSGPMGSARSGAEPTLALMAESVTGPSPGSCRLATSPWPRNERSALAGLKTTSYAENAVILAHAISVGADEALLPNLAGLACEGTGSNIFAIVGGRIVTPPVSDGCLAGVTRALVLAWSDAQERSLTMAELAAADELFITSSTRDVLPVSHLDTRRMPEPSDTLRTLRDEFQRRSAAEPDPVLP